MNLLKRNARNIMITLTTNQLKSELALLIKNKINLLFPTKAEVTKYMKVKRNGQSFTVVRADREEVLKMVCKFAQERRVIMSKRIPNEIDYEGMILRQQEIRDYNC